MTKGQTGLLATAAAVVLVGLQPAARADAMYDCDGAGVVVDGEIVNLNGRTSCFYDNGEAVAYDGQVSTAVPLGSPIGETYLAYDSDNQVIQVTSPDRVTQVQYDGAGNVTQSTVEPLGRVTQTQYDAEGEPTQSTVDPLGLVTQTQYDAQGQVTQQTVEPLDRVTQTQYDAQGLVSQTTVDPLGLVTQTQYDAQGQVTQQTVNPLDRVTQTQYDPDGQVSSITETLGSMSTTTTFTYDGPNMLLSEIDIDGDPVTSFIYDSDDRLTTITNSSSFVYFVDDSNPVPEPGSLLSLGTALAFLAARRRRR